MSESLYDSLGGNKAVFAAVDIFYRKVLSDDRVNHFFDTVDMDKQRGKQRKFLAYAFGAPLNYDGKDMREAHKHLDLTEEHFTAIAENLQGTLEGEYKKRIVGFLLATSPSAEKVDDKLNRSCSSGSS